MTRNRDFSRQYEALFRFEANDGEPDENDPEIVIPEDLSELSDEDLDPEAEGSLANRAVTYFDELYASEPDTAEAVNALNELADGIDSLEAEKTRRAEVRSEAKAQADALHARVHGTPAEEEPDEGDEGAGEEKAEDGSEAEPEAKPQAKPAEVKAEEKSEATAEKQPEPIAAAGAKVKQPRKINVPLSEIRKRAPEPEAEPRLAITAAADVPGMTAGKEFASLTDLAMAFHKRAQAAPQTATGEASGPAVATIHRKFEWNVGRDSSDADIAAMIKEITNPETLVAAGGWCAPSETVYTFFDITCEDGMLDLPTFGVSRGGIRHPVSPGLSDVFTGDFDNTTNPWLWTETDDILAVTGEGFKPCVRVPCPSFTDRRLEAYGICVTAGNFTDAAFPEAIEHQLGLLQSAHFHAINQRHIAVLSTMSTVAPTGGFFSDAGAISVDLPAAVGWAATDYRTRHGMCQDAILETVLPIWAKDAIREDLAQRTGVDMTAVTDAQINAMFDLRSVRVQWVNDWQVRGTNQPGGATPTVLYPASVQFLLYAAGTFGLGSGPTLDLGVVRDSVLNAKNDHTAAWSEESNLIAMFGNEARRYQVAVCVAGRTGIANLADCKTAE